MIGDDVPADGPRRVNSVWLSIMLSRNFSSSISYDAQNAKLSNSCAAEGFVWNTESRFQSARCRVEFYVDNTDRLAAFAREEGLADICGGVKVAAGLVPETFESNGHQIAMTPISVSIALGIDVRWTPKTGQVAKREFRL